MKEDKGPLLETPKEFLRDTIVTTTSTESSNMQSGIKCDHYRLEQVVNLCEKCVEMSLDSKDDVDKGLEQVYGDVDRSIDQIRIEY